MIASLFLGTLALFQQEELDLPTPFREVHVEVKADVWFASFAGSGALNNWFGNERDTEKDAPRFSFDREGRLGSSEPVPGGALEIIATQGRQIRGFGIQYLQADWSESGTIDQTFVVDGTTVPAGSAFTSRMVKRTASAYGIAGIQLVDVPLEARMRVGFLFHQETFRMDTTSGALKDGAGGLNVDLGGRLELRPVPFLFAAGDASASIGFGIPEVRAAISGGVVWNEFRLEGGYRHLWTGWDAGPIFRLSMGGPFVGGSITF